MNRRLLWGILAGVTWAFLASRPSRIRVSAPVEADPNTLLNLVAQVEREPEFIPYVEEVRVESREGETVRYRVEARAAGLSAWARFSKTVRVEVGRSEWTTLDGILGFDQWGHLDCEKQYGVTVATVTAVTRFHLPLVGPILAHLSAPALTYIFSVWLKNLDQAVMDSPEAGQEKGVSAPNTDLYSVH